MTKKVRNFVALLLAFVVAAPTLVFGFENRMETDIRLFIEGAEVSTGERGNQPLNVDGRVFLPIRALTTAFGREVHWEPSTLSLYFGQRENAVATNVLTGVDGEARTLITLEEVEALDIVDFEVVDRGNNRSFTGVPLVDVFNQMGAYFGDPYGFAFIAADGMSTTATFEDTLENGWLVVGEDGERFTAREDGGRGPFMVVFAEDGVPGRWARMLMEIQVIRQPEGNIQPIGATVYADGNPMESDVIPFMLDGVIYLPVRALSLALGMEVNWNATENAIYVGDTPQTFDAIEGGQLAVNAGGQQLILTMDDILEIGLVDTYAVVRDERRDFTGVPIISIMEFLGLDVSAATGQVTFSARDGHGTAATPAEAFDPTNGFIVIAENGVPLGHWEAGGRGPFMVVFAHDVFAQRFIRYLTDINVEGVSAPAGADDRWNNHPLNIVIGDTTFTMTTGQLYYYLGAIQLEWNNQEFIAVEFEAVAGYLGINNIQGGRIVADNGTEHNLTIEDIGNMYIGIYQVGHEPATDNHFTTVFVEDTNNQRRMRGFATFYLDAELGAGADGRWNNHPLNIVVGSRNFTMTAGRLYALGATQLEWNNQEFIAVEFEIVAIHLGIDNIQGGRIVADNGTEHNLTIEDIGNMYIGLYQVGHEPATDNHFTTVFVEDTNNQRRMRGFATFYLDADVEAAYPLYIEIGGRSYGITQEILEELGAEAVTARERNWTGTPMTAVIQHFGINLDGIAEGVVISGGTGFTQPFTIDELLDETNFFLAFEEDGETLEIQEGTNSNIMSLFAHDERATRGVRGVVTIRLMTEDAGADVAATVDGLEDGEFVILRGENSWTITMDDLVEIGLEDFVTNIPTGGGSTRYFTGVRLSAILESQNIGLDGATNFITTSWESTFSAGWNIATELDYIFIVVAEDGEVLTPHNGPFFGVVQHRGSNFNPRNLQSIRIN